MASKFIIKHDMNVSYEMNLKLCTSEITKLITLHWITIMKHLLSCFNGYVMNITIVSR